MVRKIILWILVILWAVVIFSFSAQPATESSELSTSVTKGIIKNLPIIRNLPPAEQEAIVKEVHNLVRKIAHFIIYAVLGFLVWFLCKSYELPIGRCFIYSILACMLYAASDEIHQLFSAGRGCRAVDVLLDTVGSAFGALMAFISVKLFKKMKRL